MAITLSSGWPASRAAMAVISLVSEAIGVTSSAALAKTARCAAASNTSAFADMSRSLAGSGSTEEHNACAENPHAKTRSSSRFIRRVWKFFSAGLIAYQQVIVNQNAQSSTYVDDRSTASASASGA